MTPRRNLQQWLQHIESVHYRTIDMSLERPRKVLKQLGLSAPPFAVVGVSGTNGKGSSVAYLEAIYGTAGYKVGAYTSPHLVRYNERIRVNGAEASDAELCSTFELVDRLRGDTPLTYFEFSTLVAAEIFRAHEIELAILEVGMGARLDAVNLFDAEVALITSVGIDHVAWLGRDREAIGYEKCGLFRPGRLGVCADPNPPRVIAQQATRVGTRLFQLGVDFGCRLAAGEWDWWGPNHRISGLPGSLDHPIQIQNAAGALMVVECMQARFGVGDAAIRHGLTRARCPGRLQEFAGPPLRILDVAHNVEAVQVLRDHLVNLSTAGRNLAVIAMLQDKPHKAMVDVLAALIDAWYVAPLDVPRGAPAASIVAVVREVIRDCVLSEHASVKAAYQAACDDAAHHDRIVVFGSFHTVGAIMPLLQSTT